MDNKLIENFPKPQGFFTVKLISPEGEVVEEKFSKNVITYTATNIFARSLGGDTSFNPSHILVGGSNIIPGVFPTVSREDTELDASTDPVVDPVNHIRSALPIATSSFTSSPTDTNTQPAQQNSNVVTYTAVMPGFPDDTDLNGKNFFEAGIISKVGSSDFLVTHQFHEAIQKLEGFQLVYTWSIRFI